MSTETTTECEQDFQGLKLDDPSLMGKLLKRYSTQHPRSHKIYDYRCDGFAEGATTFNSIELGFGEDSVSVLIGESVSHCQVLEALTVIRDQVLLDAAKVPCDSVGF